MILRPSSSAALILPAVNLVRIQKAMAKPTAKTAVPTNIIEVMSMAVSPLILLIFKPWK
jgi:hypothetical protein